MIYFQIAILLIVIIIFLFSSSRFSPIPYFPSNKKDLNMIIKALNLKNKQVVIDLGSGDGIVIFAAAKQAWKKKLSTEFVSIEINPVLIAIQFLKRLFSPNRKNIKIVRGDIFNIDYSQHIVYKNPVFYIYISPWHMEKTVGNIIRQVKYFSLVSYMYPVSFIKNRGKKISGVNEIFLYRNKKN